MLAEETNFVRRAFSGLPTEIWVISGALFINRFGTMVLPYLTLYLTENHGYSDFQAGLMLSVYGVGSMLGAWLGGKLARPIGPIRLQIILFLVGGADLSCPTHDGNRDRSGFGIGDVKLVLRRGSSGKLDRDHDPRSGRHATEGVWIATSRTELGRFLRAGDWWFSGNGQFRLAVRRRCRDNLFMRDGIAWLLWLA